MESRAELPCEMISTQEGGSQLSISVLTLDAEQ